LRIRQDLFHDQLNGLFQLRILSFYHQVGPVFHNDIWLHPVIFYHPLAVQVIAGRLWTGDKASVNERDIAANAANTTPGSFSDERAKFVVLEVVAEQVAVGSGVVIGNAGHSAVEDDRWNRPALPVAIRSHPSQHSPQPFEDQLIHKTAAVVAHVDDQAFLTNLREVLFDELI